MTGLTRECVDAITELVLPSLADIVRWQYADMWWSEFQILDQWRKAHGLTALFDVNEGEFIFCPGVFTDVKFGEGHLILIFT